MIFKKNSQHNILFYYVVHRVWHIPFLSFINYQASQGSPRCLNSRLIHRLYYLALF